MIEAVKAIEFQVDKVSGMKQAFRTLGRHHRSAKALVFLGGMVPPVSAEQKLKYLERLSLVGYLVSLGISHADGVGNVGAAFRRAGKGDGNMDTRVERLLGCKSQAAAVKWIMSQGTYLARGGSMDLVQLLKDLEQMTLAGRGNVVARWAIGYSGGEDVDE